MQQYINHNAPYPPIYGAQPSLPYAQTPYPAAPLVNNYQPAYQNMPQMQPNMQPQNTAPVNYFAPQAPVIPTPAQNNLTGPQNIAPLANDTLSLSNNTLAQNPQNTNTIPQNELNMTPLNNPYGTENSALNKKDSSKSDMPVAPQNEPLNMGVVDGPSNLSKTPVTDTLALNEKTQRIQLPQNKAPGGSFSGKISAGLQAGAMALGGIITFGTIIALVKKFKK